MFKLRGHHLFCLLGYRGMGYSEEFIGNMTLVYQSLRNDPKSRIQLVHGPDQLCEKYPNAGNYHCQDHTIYEMDTAILEKLGLKIGQILKWEEIEARIQEHVIPSDLQTLCNTCSWRSYGVCEEGIQGILEGKGLREMT